MYLKNTSYKLIKKNIKNALDYSIGAPSYDKNNSINDLVSSCLTVMRIKLDKDDPMSSFSTGIARYMGFNGDLNSSELLSSFFKGCLSSPERVLFNQGYLDRYLNNELDKMKSKYSSNKEIYKNAGSFSKSGCCESMKYFLKEIRNFVALFQENPSLKIDGQLGIANIIKFIKVVETDIANLEKEIGAGGGGYFAKAA